MAETFKGMVSVTKTSGTVATVRINGNHGNLVLGGDGSDGDLAILDKAGNTRFNISGDGMDVQIREAGGTIVVRMGPNGNITLGGGGHDGDLLINRSDGTRVVHLDGQNANLWMGGSGADGDIILFPASAAHSNTASNGTIHLNGDSGDIILRNADCAEDFDAGEDLDAGLVAVIDDDGQIHASSRAYDRRVAGVVSGAGSYRPGVVLDRQPGIPGRSPIAIAGKVFCRVDASKTPVQVGDLLTTSDRRGHAMAASDMQRAFGAVIGKALGRLDSGVGLVPLLVGLQ